jgi:membrane fusion protein (multidrug efflux system)
MKNKLNDLMANYSDRQIKYVKIFAAAALCVAIYNIYLWFKTESTDNAYLEADISNVAAQVNGVLEHIMVKEHESVKQGDIIAAIEQDNYLMQLQKAEGSLEMAKHDIEIIEQDIKLTQLEQKKARQSYEFAEKNFNVSNIDYKRISELSKDNYASKKSLDDSRISVEKNKNELAQAKLNLEMVLERLDSLQIRKAASEAKYKNALAEYNLANRDLANTKIRAPIDGVVANSALRAGNYVRTGGVLFSIVPNQGFYVQANFKETQISKFKLGASAKVTFDAYKGYVFDGVVRSISPATGSKFSFLPSSNTTGNFTKIVQRVPVLIDINIPKDFEGKLAPGMSAIVKVQDF